MKVLGLSSHYHDASAAVVVNGRVVAASAEERFTIQKHDPSFPTLAARFCLDAAKIKAHELDLVMFHEDPAVKFSRNLSTALAKFPFSLGTFFKCMEEAIGSGFWIRNEISKRLDVHPSKIKFMPHHLSHAAHALLTSPFDASAVLVIDAVGEWACTSLFSGDKTKRRFLELLEVVPFPHSLGLVYSAFTSFLGFKVNDGECSTMALAAFGQPRFAKEIRKILTLLPGGTYSVDLSYFDFTSSAGVPVTKKFVGLFGEPRHPSQELPFDALAEPDAQAKNGDAQRYADVAASLQMVLEEVILHLAAHIKEKSGFSRLCLAGGVALNCVANGKLLHSGLFDDVYVPPDPGDGGAAMGAALYGYGIAMGAESLSEPPGPFLGASYSPDVIRGLVTNSKHEIWRRFSTKSLNYGKIFHKIFDSEALLVREVAQDLLNGSIVGWFQGRFECGPRALGARSILSDPRRIDVARRLGATVKGRATYRPYACSILEDFSKEILELPERGTGLFSWMQASAKVKDSYVPRLRAATHVDHTTRAQLCGVADGSRYAALLREFGRISGIPALLNTSFNESGLPIVANPTHALAMFARTNMDVLVVENTIFRKEGLQ